ncbi:MAG TPA: MaoC family dehydratase [Streptosporangiaceae bacterium]|nr:MaoC family dehydratase [Streptosporangiaceae bacterium]
MLVLRGPKALHDHAGQELGVSGWVRITQAEVDAFADLTHDHQWIHVDVERARASAFGTTIVHGYFTLSLAPRLQDEIYRVDGFGFGLNYGLNRVRFPAPLPVGDRVRLRVTLEAVQEVPGGLQCTITDTFERDGGGKPVCVAEMIFRMYEPEEG